MSRRQQQARASGIDAYNVWDMDDALTRLCYGIFLHVKNRTKPEESELLEWWHQLLTAQVAINALVAANVGTSVHPAPEAAA